MRAVGCVDDIPTVIPVLRNDSARHGCNESVLAPLCQFDRAGQLFFKPGWTGRESQLHVFVHQLVTKLVIPSTHRFASQCIRLDPIGTNDQQRIRGLSDAKSSILLLVGESQDPQSGIERIAWPKRRFQILQRNKQPFWLDDNTVLGALQVDWATRSAVGTDIRDNGKGRFAFLLFLDFIDQLFLLLIDFLSQLGNGFLLF